MLPECKSAALLSVAALFFSLLHTDNRKLNRMEDRLDLAVNQLPPGQRVISTLPAWSLRSLCFRHVLDRACIGHCSGYADVDAVASGAYVVQPRDLPVYLIYPCSSDVSEICDRPLQAGESSEKPK
jgi:hypothetical protein